MRTKIYKRIGPVPITLVAVFALAAFLSAGLLLTTGSVQTAEAQSADCTRNASQLGAWGRLTTARRLAIMTAVDDSETATARLAEAATVAIPGDSDRHG